MKKTIYKYQRVRDLREDRDLTQQQVADYLNLYLNTYRRYETGQNTIPINLMKKLSVLYNVSMDYLTEIEEEIKY
ncbi:MAG: helix-turn-helix domain-containing protein [Eubacterium sp.]|nr:helix-turn-helix domain-containing protein [Eubacterium sp.]